MRRFVVTTLLAGILGLPLCSPAMQFETFTNINVITKAILLDGPFVWAGTDGGLVRWYMPNCSSDRFTTSEGLASNHVFSLALDLSGGVWVGTFRGASRNYRGTWLTFDDNSRLIDPRVEAVWTSSDGRVWFGTAGGVTVFDGKSFESYTIQDGLADNWVKDITECAGILYFATENGVSVYDGSSWQTISTTDGLPSNDISCLATTANRLFIGTHGSGVCLFDGSSIRLFTPEDGIQGSVIADLYADPRGYVWAATELGLSVWTDPDWLSFSYLDGLPDDQLLSIAADANGNVYAGTAANGLWCWYQGRTFSLASPEGLLDNQVHCVTPTSDGSVWFGCEEGFSVLQTDGLWQSYRDVAGKPLGKVNAILEDTSRQVWLATDQAGLARFHDGQLSLFTSDDGLCSNTVHSLAIIGNILLAGTNKGLSAYDGTRFYSLTPEDGLPFASIDALAVDPDGTILMGNNSANGGLVILQGSQLTHYTVDDGLPSNNIYSINADRDHVVWIGTDLGAVRWDAQGITTFGRAEGLVNFVVTAITYGPSGDVWFATAGGVSRYDNNSFENFTQADGIADNRVQDITQGNHGDLWIATLGGATRIQFAGATEPQVEVSVSQPSYHPGETVSCSLSLSNPGQTRALDIYIALIAPNGALYSLTAQGRWLKDDIVPWAQGLAIPSGANITMHPLVSIHLPSYYPRIAEPGTYAFASAIFDASTSQLIGAVALATFQVTD